MLLQNVIGYNKQRAFCIKSTLVGAHKVARRKNIKFKGKSLFQNHFKVGLTYLEEYLRKY